MKTFLKILLVVVLVVLAIKLLPAALLFLGGIAAAIGLLGAVGASLLAVVVCFGLVFLALTSPLWIPLLLLAGIIALIRRVGSGGVKA